MDFIFCKLHQKVVSLMIYQCTANTPSAINEIYAKIIIVLSLSLTFHFPPHYSVYLFTAELNTKFSRTAPAQASYGR